MDKTNRLKLDTDSPYYLPLKIAKIVGLVILGLVLFFNAFTIIPPGHRGVAVFLGKIDPAVRGEGVTFQVPFLQQVNIIPVQQLTATDKTTCFSKDLQTVDVTYSVLYRLPADKVVQLFQEFAGNPYTAQVVPRLEESLKQVTATYRAEDAVKSREAIKIDVIEKLRSNLEGMVDIRDVVIRNIDLTDELEKAIELKQVAEQQAFAKEYELKKAIKDAEITVVGAKAEAEAVKIKGEAIAQNPKVIDLEIAKKWDGKTPQSVVTSAGGSNILLPLR
jgi:prohibitin 2